MGSLAVLRAQRARQRSTAAANPQQAAADVQDEARRYGTGAAGEELAAVTKENVMSQGEGILKRLELAGQTQGRDYERAATMARLGHDPNQLEEPFLAKAIKPLEWLDKLGAVVRFGIADVTGMDTRAGTELGGDDWKDIWAGNTESIIERHGEGFVGKEGRLSGQALLENIGYELEAKRQEGGGGSVIGNWSERQLHGLASLVTEIFTDPLTAVAAGGSLVTRRASILAAEKLGITASSKAAGLINLTGPQRLRAVAEIASPYERRMVRATLVRADAKVAAKRAEIAAANRGLRNRSLYQAMGRTPLGLTDEMLKPIMKEAIAESVEAELRVVGKSLATRDFGALEADFVKYADEARMAYLGGGARLTLNPVGASGVRIPMTRGAGRKASRAVFGTPAQSAAERGFLGRRITDASGRSGLRGALDRPGVNFTTKIHELGKLVGRENTVLQAFARNSPDAVKQLHLERATKEMTKKLPLNQIKREVGQAGLELNKASKAAKLSADEETSLFRELFQGIQGGQTAAEGIIHADANVQAAARTFAVTWREQMQTLHRVARESGMELGEIDNYISLIKGKKVEEVFDQMRLRGVEINVPPGLSEEEMVGWQLLSEIYAAHMRRARSGRKALGEPGFTHERNLGKTVLRITDMGEGTLFEGLRGADVAFLNHADMNDGLTAALRQVANDHRIPIPSDLSALEMNPFEVANKYINSMSNGIVEAVMVKEARKVGLIVDATFEIDAGRLIAGIREGLNGVAEGGKSLPEGKRRSSPNSSTLIAGVLNWSACMRTGNFLN